MTMQKTLGGDRLGSGKKMKVDLHGYERSTHNLGYLWRSTMSSGTLVPFLCEVALPGDTFDIDLDCVIKTHPTIGPLFGSFKVQLDVFHAPIRLYQGALHNNKLGIGRNMSQIKLPQIRLEALANRNVDSFIGTDPDNAQINPSCILAYLGLRGVGTRRSTIPDPVTRDFNATALLAYWDIYKNYYANKQEEIGAVIHNTQPPITETIDVVVINGEDIGEYPMNTNIPIFLEHNGIIQLNWTGTRPQPNWVILITDKGEINLQEVGTLQTAGIEPGPTSSVYVYNAEKYGSLLVHMWRYAQPNEIVNFTPNVVTFPLENIDKMREGLLSQAGSTTPKIINVDAETSVLTPYNYLTSTANRLSTQEGLAIKTYNSDLFNNWLKTEWIDGPGGINEITAIDTSGGSFNIDTLNLSKKVYNMLNRIMVSGGTYDDWVDAVYTHDRFTRIESPVYHGGLIKELVFQEVVSNATIETVTTGEQPLGTLAGKGVMSGKNKGGKLVIKIDEPSYIIGIVSLTPRIDYSQGNKWDVNLKTMDDFHKPALDEIGFQELIIEQMAWWTTSYQESGGGNFWQQFSAGKQPAWINYMTNVNRTFGNFAIETNEMFMTLNRKYEPTPQGPDNMMLVDLTTYIDPKKYNNIFAQTSLDAQNFWTQIAVDMIVRRKMSAKVMPNL